MQSFKKKATTRGNHKRKQKLQNLNKTPLATSSNVISCANKEISVYNTIIEKYVKATQ